MGVFSALRQGCVYWPIVMRSHQVLDPPMKRKFLRLSRRDLRGKRAAEQWLMGNLSASLVFCCTKFSLEFNRRGNSFMSFTDTLVAAQVEKSSNLLTR